MAKRVENERKFNEVRSILKLNEVDLPLTAQFIEMVYEFGSHSVSKEYSKEVRKHVKAIDAKIVELAIRAALFNKDAYLTRLLLDLANIRSDLDGHYWRAERIIEIMEKERAF